MNGSIKIWYQKTFRSSNREYRFNDKIELPEVSFLIDPEITYYYGDTLSVEVKSNYINSDNIYFVETTDSSRFIESYQTKISNNKKECKIYLDSLFTYEFIKVKIINDVFNYEYEESVNIIVKEEPLIEKFVFESKLEYSDVYAFGDTLKIDITKDIIENTELFIDSVKLINPTKIHDSLYYFIIPEVEIGFRDNKLIDLELKTDYEVLKISKFKYYQNIGFFDVINIKLNNFKFELSSRFTDPPHGSSSKIDTVIHSYSFNGSSTFTFSNYGPYNSNTRISDGLFNIVTYLQNSYHTKANGNYQSMGATRVNIADLESLNLNYIPNKNSYYFKVDNNHGNLDNININFVMESRSYDYRGGGSSNEVNLLSSTDSSNIEITLSR